MSAGRWPLERVLFLLAGTVTLASAALAALVTPWFLLLTAFVGAEPVGVRVLRSVPVLAVSCVRVFGFRKGCAQ